MQRCFTRPSTDDKGKKMFLDEMADLTPRKYKYKTLVTATGDFDEDHKIGSGGFGPVFKGVLNNGKSKSEIAIKRLSSVGSSHGDKQFKNEILSLARLSHKNIVRLLGYCMHDGNRETLLVYEYFPKGSLDKLLFSTEFDKRDELDWKRRFTIICGISQGLIYLHNLVHQRIVHRDIKAGNILLDNSCVPKIADFGLARFLKEDQTQVSTKTVAGTLGYMPPEYYRYAKISDKLDVYSFGVLVLEIISGRQISSFPAAQGQSLLEKACKLVYEEKSLEMVDSTIAASADTEQVTMCIKIGVLCTREDPQSRPTMQKVAQMLSGNQGILEELMSTWVPGSGTSHQRPTNMSFIERYLGDTAFRTSDPSMINSASLGRRSMPRAISSPINEDSSMEIDQEESAEADDDNLNVLQDGPCSHQEVANDTNHDNCHVKQASDDQQNDENEGVISLGTKIPDHKSTDDDIPTQKALPTSQSIQDLYAISALFDVDGNDDNQISKPEKGEAPSNAPKRPYYSGPGEDEEHDPTPYIGDNDIHLQYGRPLSPSKETCYPSTPSHGNFDSDCLNFSACNNSPHGDVAVKSEHSSNMQTMPRPSPRSVRTIRNRVFSE